MTSTDEPALGRKRITTYGKPHRKRAQDDFVFFDAPRKNRTQDVVHDRPIAVASPPSKSLRLKSSCESDPTAALEYHRSPQDCSPPARNSLQRLAASNPSEVLSRPKPQDKHTAPKSGAIPQSSSDGERSPVSPPKRRRLGQGSVTPFSKKPPKKSIGLVAVSTQPDDLLATRSQGLEKEVGTRVPKTYREKQAHNASKTRSQSYSPGSIEALQPSESKHTRGQQPGLTNPSLNLAFHAREKNDLPPKGEQKKKPTGSRGPSKCQVIREPEQTMSDPQFIAGPSPRHLAVLSMASPSPVRTPLSSSEKELQVAGIPEQPQQLKSPLQRNRTPARKSFSEDELGLSSQHTAPASITPRGMGMWMELLHNHKQDLSGQKQAVTQRPCLRATQSMVIPPRKRLIDTLVDQADGIRPFAYELDSSDNEASEDTLHRQGTGSSQITPTEFDLDEIESSPRRPPRTQSASQSSQAAGVRVTYSRQRSMLAEQVMSEKMSFEVPLHDPQALERRTRRGSVPVLIPLAGFHDIDEEDDSQSSTKIRTIHELRHAGATDRFNDEAGDILDQIGSPGTKSSLRRSALLDLAGKMNQKWFLDLFTSHSMDQKLFMHLGRETDVISGFIMLSILLKMLDNGICAITVTQLLKQDVASLLLRLLEAEEWISSIAKDRKSNVSKLGQTSLAQHTITILNMKIWDGVRVERLSPRTLALKCLETMIRQVRDTGDAGDVMSKELTFSLFKLIKASPEQSNGDLLSHLQTTDFQLSLSTLEAHSLRAKTASDESMWIQAFLPVIRDTLECTLRFTAKEADEQQMAALRLALNVTNNNAEASDVFAQSNFLRMIGKAVVDKFTILSGFLLDEERALVVDQLVLMLGFLINFTESSKIADSCFQALRNDKDDSLPRLISVFADNLDRMAEAVSQEDVHRNIPFGYLSVLLGYICLMPAVGNTIRAGLRIPQLVVKVEEFLNYNKSIEAACEDAEDAFDANSSSSSTERLQDMVDRLRAI